MKQALIARQPIVDAHVRVVGYELLYRSSDGPADRSGLSASDGDGATATVAMNALLDLGIESIAGDRPVFLNMTRSFFERELYTALPPEQVVLEILEDITPDEAFLQAVRRARGLGYKIALDDYLYNERLDALVQLSDIVKVEVIALDDEAVRHHAELLRRPGLKLLAEKVETHERFRVCRDAGYDLFQGWFYAKPDLMRRRALSTDRLALLQLLELIERPQVTFEEIGAMVERNLSLSHKLLRYVNSALYALPNKVESVRHACTMLGLERVRTCITLLLLSEVNEKPDELMRNALCRARMCQLLGDKADLETDQKYFTVGMFSLLDAYLDRSLAELLEEIPFSDDVKRAILDHEGAPGAALQTAIAAERADWNQVRTPDVDAGELQRLHVSALEWTRDVMRALDPGDAH